MEKHILKLEERIAVLEYTPTTVDKRIQETVETAQRVCGAIHQEAVDFVDYIVQAREEINEFKEVTTKEIRSLIKRTKKYQVDDNKDILLEED